ncbi:hypothetical protein [Pseudomonas lopnurensis]|uniref:hypothetical protein n=1 Tax=Pseudomonas lopnurensis TaxID=1477517 RepID=UPI0028AE629F|nr:hypothetical protein [Pseudomonas lopnurensis]
MAAVFIVYVYKSKGRFARTVAKSSTFKDFLGGNSRLSRILFSQFEEFAWRSNNATFLYNVATIYRLKKKYTKAFEIFFHLFKIRHNVNHCLRAMSCELQMKDKPLCQYFLEHKERIPKNVALLMECEYSQYFNDVDVRWLELQEAIEKEFFLPLINKGLLAALANKNIEFILWVEDILIERLTEENKEYLRRTFTMLAACYYRTGRLSELRLLDSRVSYDNSDWKLYMSFGLGDLMGVMDHRGKTIKGSFSLYYPKTAPGKNKRALVPEKDLCGEAFNSLFYPAVLANEGGFTVVCDTRLYTLMRNNFPEIDFIPKTPRYMLEKKSDLFDRLPYNLSSYLDNVSYKATLGFDFFTIDYRKYFLAEDSQQGRVTGWIKPSSSLVDFWKKKLSVFSGKSLIGFCANSTVRSRIRDMHMISIDYWTDIFALKNTVFINLNASLDDIECFSISERFGVEVFNPGFDLFNDFDNLLALMSVLDFGVLPANNLMDFAAAVGLKSIVFSPSNIMRSWILEGEDSYVFSRNITFVLPDAQGDDEYYLVRKGSDIICRSLTAN